MQYMNKNIMNKEIKIAAIFTADAKFLHIFKTKESQISLITFYHQFLLGSQLGRHLCLHQMDKGTRNIRYCLKVRDHFEISMFSKKIHFYLFQKHKMSQMIFKERSRLSHRAPVSISCYVF